MCMSNEQNPSFPQLFMAPINLEHSGLSHLPLSLQAHLWAPTTLPPDPSTTNPIPGKIKAAQGLDITQITQIWLWGHQVPVSSARFPLTAGLTQLDAPWTNPLTLAPPPKAILKSVWASTPRQMLGGDLLVQAAHLTPCHGTYQCMVTKDSFTAIQSVWSHRQR